MKTQKTSRYGTADFTRDEAMFKANVEPRMRELLSLNVPFNWDKHSSAEFDKRWKRQTELIEELEKHAFVAKSMTGRTVRFQMADSYAVYLVTRVNKTTCRLQWLDVGDGWEDARLGEQGSLPIAFVHEEICRHDRMREIFSNKNVVRASEL
jgi:hypothetical protein